MTWQILDQKQTQNIVQAVRSAGLADLFGTGTSEGRVYTLPFYRSCRLYRLTNYATLPAFSMYYLGDGNNFTYLDGSPDVLESHNRNDNLMLNQETILPYLDFYLTHVSLEVGEIKITGDRDNDSMLISYPEDAEIEHETSRNIYIVKVPLYYDGTIMLGTVEINALGHVQIIKTEMKMQGVSDTNVDYGSSDTYF